MTESQYASWWEKSSNLEFVFQFIAHPFVVLRQIGVACDILQAPHGSDHETYPTLLPREALEITRQK